MRQLATVCLLTLALVAPGCRKPFGASHAARGQEPMEAPVEEALREPVVFRGLDLSPPGWSKDHAYHGPNHMVAYLRWQGEGAPLMVNALSARSPEEAARWVRRAFDGAGAAPGALGRRGVAGLQTDAGERAFGVALGTVAIMVKGSREAGILPSAYMVGLLQGNREVAVTAAFAAPAEDTQGGGDVVASLLEELDSSRPVLPRVPERPLEEPALEELPRIQWRPVIAEPDLADPDLGEPGWEPLPPEEVEVRREPAGEAVGLIARAAPPVSEHHSEHGDLPADPVDVPPFRRPAYPVETAASEARLPAARHVEEAVRAAARLVAAGVPEDLTRVASAATPPRGDAVRAPIPLAGTSADTSAGTSAGTPAGTSADTSAGTSADTSARDGSPFTGAGAVDPVPGVRVLPPPSPRPAEDRALASELEARLAGGAPMWAEASPAQLVDDGRKLLALAQVHAAYDRFTVAARAGSPAARQHVEALGRLFPDAFPRPPLLPAPPPSSAEDQFDADAEDVPDPEASSEAQLEAAEAADAAATRDSVTPGEILLSLARRSLGQGDLRSALDRYTEIEARGLHEGTLGRREVARILERKALELTGRMWAGEVGAGEELQRLHLSFPEVFPEDDPTVLAAAAPVAGVPLASRRRRGFYVEALGLIGFLALVGVVSTRPLDPEEDLEVPPTVPA